MAIVTQKTKFNEQNYDVQIYLDAGAGETDNRKLQINPNSIVNLVIEDTLADWVIKGNITLYYSFEAHEKDLGYAAQFISPELQAVLQKGAYFFRNDGNDKLWVDILPRLDTAFIGGGTIDNVHWRLKHRFSIYDMEDIDLPPGAENAASTAVKCKKLYFWDYFYHTMITNTLAYSTADSDYNNIDTAPRSTSVSDKNRSIFTGQAIKEVILKTFTLSYNNGDVDYYLTDKIIGGDKKEWEDGASTIFYTTPASNNAYDILMSIYDRHVSNDAIADNFIHDFSILHIERGPTDGDVGYFSLKPISKFFEKAGKATPGEYQIERFNIQDYVDKKSPTSERSPKLSTQNMQIDTKLGAYSQISSYRFVDISAFTNATKFRSRPVYSYDFKNRTHNIEFDKNSVCTARKFMVDQYISKVMTENGSNDSNFLITLEKSKKRLNIEPVFSLYGNKDDFEDGKDFIARQADGLQKLLKTGVFQNSCIHFRCLGSTNREPGRFIAIDKTSGVEDEPFNDKLFGQWFVISVRHIFEAGIYYNEIVAVKLHRFKGLTTPFPGVIDCTAPPSQSPAVTPADTVDTSGGGGGGSGGGGGGGGDDDNNVLDPFPDNNSGDETLPTVEPELPTDDDSSLETEIDLTLSPADLPLPELEPLPDS